VTNEIMKGRSLVPNRNISTMALAHREELGNRLLRICRRIRQLDGRCDDGGDRIELLLDAGADPAIRDNAGAGQTALHHLIRAGRADLARILLRHAGSVLAVDESGESAADAAEKMTGQSTKNQSAVSEWYDLAKELRRRAKIEKEREDARARARERSNEEHRERQRELAADERERSRAGAATAGGAIRGGLGSLEEGWGYFPSLSALQFQDSIPPPSPSLADWERREKKRLDLVLRSVAAVVVLYLILC